MLPNASGRKSFRRSDHGAQREPCRRSHVAATETHLDAHSRHQRRQNNICRGQEIVENGEESCDSQHSSFDVSDCVWAAILQRSGHGGPARTHADILIWRPPGRTWTRTGGTSGARITSAENKKSLKTVGSHPILNISFQCYRLRLGGDSLG